MIRIVITGLVVLVGVLFVWRHGDRRADAKAWQSLIVLTNPDEFTYQPALVQQLPEPAQRYFNFTIEDGAPLHTRVELQMAGELGLGSHAAPTYRAMSARQVLAPPLGFVWQVESGSMGGSDALLPSHSWSRFWLFGLVPLARVSGRDHRRSAFGRMVAEAAIWAPAALLPNEHVRWQARDGDRARATVTSGDLEQAVDITVSFDGALRQVVIQRWSNENADGIYRLQPFGGVVSSHQRFEGYRLPTRIEGGNHWGTDAYFPFFRAEIDQVRFPSRASSE